MLAASQADRIEATMRFRSSIARPSSTYGQVVDRAVDRQLADVAAGEEQRPHDEGISRQCNSRRQRAVGLAMTA
jgi:hypothetical protein